MRATMSIPGVFAPVNWDAWLLVDGGVLNNVPANVARQLGADIVIAVNVGADVGDEKAQTASLLALLGKTIDTMMTTSTRRSLESADLIIDPDLKGLTSMSWRSSDELADRGYQAAAALEGKLQGYAIASDAHAAFQTARQSKRRRDISVPTQITFEEIGLPVSPRVQAEVRRAFTPMLTKAVEPDAIAQQILEITGDDRYEYLTYEITDRPTPTSLQIGVRQKTYGPPFLMVGLDLNNIDSSNFAVNLTSRVLQYGLVGVGSETRLDFVLGTNQRLAAELVKPIGATPIFVGHASTSIGAGGICTWMTSSWPSTGPGSSVSASISGAISDATPKCGSVTTSPTTTGDGGWARRTCPRSTAPNGMRTWTSPWIRRPVRSSRHAGSVSARHCASISRRRQPAVPSTAPWSTARNRSRAAKCGRRGSGASAAAATASSSSAKGVAHSGKIRL
jgi:hypothetical protein